MVPGDVCSSVVGGSVVDIVRPEVAISVSVVKSGWLPTVDCSGTKV